MKSVATKVVAARMQTRSGFTLLELVLTLSLTVVLMSLIGGAIQFYGRDMATGEAEIRQTQLASVLMQMIEDDLRATLHAEPVDMSGLEALLASAGSDSSGGGGAGGATEGEDLSAAGMESSLESETDPLETATLDLTSGAAILETPGLIGNQFQIQADVSRLPRLEEYVAMLDGDNTDIEDVPSDLKTVAYYVQSADTIGGVRDTLNSLDADVTESSAGGLIRRSLDRAATIQAASNGNLASLNQTGELLAPEVTAIEFSYWDGYTWQLEWSSDTYEELPLAVRISLSMLSPVYAASNASPTTTAAAEGAMRVYTHVVRLPLARPIEEEQDMTGTGI